MSIFGEIGKSKSRNSKRKHIEDSIAMARKTTFDNNTGSEL